MVLTRGSLLSDIDKLLETQQSLVCSLYQSFGVVKVWNMKKMADIYQQDSFKRSCSGTGRLDILLSNQSGICWTTLRCQENCWTHAVFE